MSSTHLRLGLPSGLFPSGFHVAAYSKSKFYRPFVGVCYLRTEEGNSKFLCHLGQQSTTVTCVTTPKRQTVFFSKFNSDHLLGA